MTEPDPLHAEVEKVMRAARPNSHVAYRWAVAVAVKAILREQMKWDGYGLAEVFRERAEAAEKERDGWRVKCCEADQQLSEAIQERDKARRALAEYREKWGHVTRCQCRGSFSDSRCAPEPGRKA